jgi:hypothetical protein
MVAATEGLGAESTTSAPIWGCRSQIVWRTDRRDSASSVSRRRGSARGRPATSLALDLFAGRAIVRGAKAGEFWGEMLMLSSMPSSSAFRFRDPILALDV